MLRCLALVVLVWLGVTSPALAAKEDAVCVQAFLIDSNFLSGSADGALGPKSLKAAEAFLERTGLAGTLPALSDETAPQWCQFLSSGEADEQIQLASLTLYDIAIAVDDLPPIDDGTGPLRFDFAKYKLTDKFDGVACTYAMKAIFADGNSHTFVSGQLEFADGGHVSFTDSRWLTGAPVETFDRANLAITSKQQLVGTMSVVHLFADEGSPPRQAEIVVLEPEGSNLSGEVPQGKIAFDIGGDRGEMNLRCRGQDGPVKVAFDFSPYKLSTAYEGYNCTLVITSIFENGSIRDRAGVGLAEIDKNGRLTFTSGKWDTQGPADSFQVANLAITRDLRLVGALDVYALFPDPDPRPPFAIELKGTEGELDDTLKGTIEVDLNARSQAALETRCRKPR